jgi:hypothetical protein
MKVVKPIVLILLTLIAALHSKTIGELDRQLNFSFERIASNATETDTIRLDLQLRETRSKHVELSKLTKPIAQKPRIEFNQSKQRK